MKYKLINTETKEEHLCEEVITKDGTKAYVTNECPTIGEYAYDRGEIIKKTTTSDLSNYQQKVIATNNPNIDIPKVIDVFEMLAMDKLKNKWSHLYHFGYPKRPFPTNYENDLNCILVGLYKSQETHPFSAEDADAYADAVMGGCLLSAKEWKEQQPKVIYYQ